MERRSQFSSLSKRLAGRRPHLTKTQLAHLKCNLGHSKYPALSLELQNPFHLAIRPSLSTNFSQVVCTFFASIRSLLQLFAQIRLLAYLEPRAASRPMFRCYLNWTREHQLKRCFFHTSLIHPLFETASLISESLPILCYRKTYGLQSYHHVGMPKKPLMRYDPNAVRSQLPKPTVVMPYKNSSQIVIGDRSTLDRRNFKTTNGLYQQKPDLHEQTTNGGIIASRVKWTHKHQVMP